MRFEVGPLRLTARGQRGTRRLYLRVNVGPIALRWQLSRWSLSASVDLP